MVELPLWCYGGSGGVGVGGRSSRCDSSGHSSTLMVFRVRLICK